VLGPGAVAAAGTIPQRTNAGISVLIWLVVIGVATRAVWLICGESPGIVCTLWTRDVAVIAIKITAVFHIIRAGVSETCWRPGVGAVTGIARLVSREM
jgi:hypothetical protein